MLIKKRFQPFAADSSVLFLSTQTVSVEDSKVPNQLVFPFNGYGDEPFTRPVKVGDELKPGDFLVRRDQTPLQPCPVTGKVVFFKHVPNVYGGDPLSAVIVEPDKDQEKRRVFEPVSIQSATRDVILERIEKAGILNGVENLQSMVQFLKEIQGGNLVVVGHDVDVLVKTTHLVLNTYRNQLSDALQILKRVVPEASIALTLPEKEADALQALAKESIQVVKVPDKYPETLPRTVARVAGISNPSWINLEALFSIYKAVVEGFIPNKKTVTVTGQDGKIKGLYNYYIGTTIRDALKAAGIEAMEGDCVLVGGAFSGVAQYSLDGVIDQGVNAIRLISKKDLPEWSHDPCVSCGSCNESCPVNLQVSLLGRYSEFGLFEKTKELEIDACTECGLCATACTVRRPLLQLMRLAKKGIKKTESDEKAIHAAQPEGQKPGMFQDPSLALYQVPTRFTVGSAPFIRSKSSLTIMNYAFLFALLPAVLMSAIGFLNEAYVANQGTAFGAIPGLLNSLIGELGVGPRVLVFIGVLGVAGLGLGTGVLVEYVTQILMRQRYEATNAHGALIGLLVAFLMPPNVSPFVLVLAVAVAIIVGKQLYGGIGSYPIHPAVIGWLIVFLSWPHDIQPIGVATLGSVSLATQIAFIVGGLALWVLGFIRIRVPLGVILGVALFSFAFQGRLEGSVLDQVFQGHVMLAAFFLATDPTSSPVNKLAGFLFGLGMGFIIVLVRAYGIWPDAVPFAVMLMNIINPLLDRIRPKVLKEAV